jgi:surface antigen
VLVWDGRVWCGRYLYNDNGTAALRLCCWPRRARNLSIKAVATAVAAILAFLTVSGCSYNLASLVSTDAGEPQVTGTVDPSAGAPSSASAKASAQAELDLAYARAAAKQALSRASRDASLPWQNPHSGARGNITPLATSYSEAGMACRDFLASYIHGDAQDWLEGAACRTGSGAWEVRRLKPLKSR